MDEEGSKPCPNCKRDIPSVNFLVHSMHCDRNIKVCPVCKEPVQLAELQEHHEQQHRLLPCKFCGERVCGTDLEDHIRDSCAHTAQACRFCELELPRRSLPPHEGYCGARTERCADCGAYVMHKYRQIHRDSNHGFIKLDDEPDPMPASLSAQRARKAPHAQATNARGPRTEIRHLRPANDLWRNEAGADTTDATAFDEPQSQSPQSQSQPPQSSSQFNQPWPVLESSTRIVAKRNNDQPQLNTNKGYKNKENTKSLGAVKKRLAPRPPKSPPPCVADTIYASARHTHNHRDHQPQKPLEDRLRRPPDAIPSSTTHADPTTSKADPTTSNSDPSVPKNHLHVANGPKNLGHGFNGRKNVGSSDRARNLQRRNDFKDLKPMSHQEFMERFQELQVQGGRAEASAEDRFSNIKFSLRELRRGLNEVTAPYNVTRNAPSSPLNEAAGGVLSESAASNAATSAASSGTTSGTTSGATSAATSGATSAATSVAECNERLPCEFCGAALPSTLLIDHQVLCRPQPVRSAAAWEEEPLIPCEFCTEPLPLCRLTDHQMNCQREANVLFNE